MADERYKLGDFNLDGSVDSSDASQEASFLNEQKRCEPSNPPVTEDMIKAGDVLNVNKITAYNSNAILTTYAAESASPDVLYPDTKPEGWENGIYLKFYYTDENGKRQPITVDKFPTAPSWESGAESYCGPYAIPINYMIASGLSNNSIEPYIYQLP